MTMPSLSSTHRFLIRNWELFSISEIAEYLGVTGSHVRELAYALDLPDMQLLDRDRAFPLVLRRNHDLLSEEEIARLLRMPVEALRNAAMEMDFLDIKLGKKPQALPKINFREAISDTGADLFKSRCGADLLDYSEWEPPFSFLSELNVTELSSSATFDSVGFDLRMMYSYTGSHGDFLLTGESFYGNGILSRLRNRGINAGWIPALLRDIAPSRIFPEFGKSHEVRIANIQKEVAEAARYGIKIYLYLNEPRFLPGEFFERYPDSKGMPAPQLGHFGMCTSDERVRDWLFEATEYVFRQVPDLGGVILITASENRTNCYSHQHQPGSSNHDGLGVSSADLPICPRCEKRGPEAVLTDAATIMHDALAASGSNAQVIQWLWGWDLIISEALIREVVSDMPKNVAVMVDWAKNTPFELFGRKASVGEYTLAYVQPSSFAKGIVSATKEQGRKVIAKCALSTTVEMNALPYLPAMRNVEVLLKELCNAGVDGFLGSWIFGAYPGRNMEMVACAASDSPARVLAEKYYGSGYKHALEAWRLFSEGMRYFPHSVSVLYLSALNPGPGLRFTLDPEPWRHGMVAMASERIEDISAPFGAEVMIKGFRKVGEHFSNGLQSLAQAIEESNRIEWREDNLRDYDICESCMRHFISAANYSEFILLRDKWLSGCDTTSDMIRILKDELENAEATLKLSKRDSRIGYEGSIGYFYTPVEIIEKIYDIKTNIELLSSPSPAGRSCENRHVDQM